MKTIRLIIAEDHAIVREGLRTLIASEPSLELIGEAANGVEAVALARALGPDVVLMDLVMPGKSGVEAISEIKRDNPNIRILVLTSFSEEQNVFPAIRAGATGYLLKDTSPGQLVRAIFDVYEGEAALHPSIARKLIHELNQPTPAPATESSLSDRERSVLRLIAQGSTNQEIADQLCISDWTVRSHVRNILSKLHLSNRTQAALYAVRKGLA
jgi:two-component system, NarL family, response regulator LiaR